MKVVRFAVVALFLSSLIATSGCNSSSNVPSEDDKKKEADMMQSPEYKAYQESGRYGPGGQNTPKPPTTPQ